MATKNTSLPSRLPVLHRILRPTEKCEPRGRCCIFSAICTSLDIWDIFKNCVFNTGNWCATTISKFFLIRARPGFEPGTSRTLSENLPLDQRTTSTEIAWVNFVAGPMINNSSTPSTKFEVQNFDRCSVVAFFAAYFRGMEPRIVPNIHSTALDIIHFHRWPPSNFWGSKGNTFSSLLDTMTFSTKVKEKRHNEA